MMSFKSQLVLKQNDCSELGSIIFNIEAILFALDDCMTSTNTDIIDSYLTFMTSSKLELSLLWSNSEQMNVSRSIFVKRHTLKQNIVACCILSDFLMQINNLVDLHVNFERVGIHLFADLTLKSFPVIGAYIHICGTWSFELLLSKNPILQALEVNNTNRTFAFTSKNKRIGIVIFGTPTNSTLNLIFALINVLDTFDFHSLSKLLIIQFILGHFYLIASKILNSKSDSAELDGVELLDFIVIFASFVFQRSCYKP